MPSVRGRWQLAAELAAKGGEELMDFEVHRDDARQRYYAEIDGHEARILFAPAGDRTLDFQHTQVAPELRGHGVADTLVRHALDDVRARGERIVATCPFVKSFLGRHPEYQALLATAGPQSS